MLCIFLSDILYAKVIDDKSEHDWTGFMFEETMSVFHLMVAVGGKVGNEGIISKATGLW